MKEARLRRNLPLEIVAERAGTTRQTIARLEKGDPAVSMGIYASALLALGLLDRLAELALPSADPTGLALASEALPQRARLPRPKQEAGNE